MVWLGVRSIHQLSKRWLVLVPTGMVLHDPLVMPEPQLFLRQTMARLGAAEVDPAGPADGRELITEDLTAGASGLVMSLSLSEPVELLVRATAPEAPPCAPWTACCSPRRSPSSSSTRPAPAAFRSPQREPPSISRRSMPQAARAEVRMRAGSPVVRVERAPLPRCAAGPQRATSSSTRWSTGSMSRVPGSSAANQVVAAG